MKDYKEINILLKNYFDALKALKNAEITSNKKDFTCQIGEWLVSEIYEGTRAISGIQKDWDIDLNGKKIQVKTHAKAIGNNNRWSAIKYNEQANIDELIIVVFTEHYQLREFYKISWQRALKLIRRNKDRDIIRWDDIPAIKLADLPNQPLVSVFMTSEDLRL